MEGQGANRWETPMFGVDMIIQYVTLEIIINPDLLLQVDTIDLRPRVGDES